MAGLAAVYECCSGSQAQNISLNLAVNYGAQDSSFSGGTGQYRMPQVGDLVIVCAGVDNTAGTPNTISDTKANTWTAIQTQNGAVNQQFKCWGTIIAAGKAPTSSDSITVAFAATSGSKHLTAKVIVGPSAVTAFNQVTTQGSGGGTWSSGTSGAITAPKIQIGVLQSASAGGKPTALTFDSAGAAFTQAPSGHWSALMVDTNPPAGGQAAGGTTASGTWAAGTWTHTAPTTVTGTSAISAKKVALAAAGTYTPPVTGTAAVAAKKVALAAAGTYTDPVTGTAAFAAKKPSLAASGVYSLQATVAWAAKKPAWAASGTYTPPVTGTAGFAAKKPSLAASGVYTPAPVTGTAAWAAKKIALAASGTYSPGITGTATWRTKKIAIAASGLYAAPGTGSVAFVAKKPTWSAAGTYTPGVITGTVALASKKIAIAAVGAANIGAVTATVAWASEKIQLAALGTAATLPPAPSLLDAGDAPLDLVPVIWDQLSLNDGNRDDGLTTVVTNVDGWFGSPALDGNNLIRALTDGAIRGTKIIAPRVITIAGAAAGPRALTRYWARALAAQAAGKDAAVLKILEDDGSDSPEFWQAMVRADSDSLVVAWLGRDCFTYQVVLTAIDPRLYSSELHAHTLLPLVAGTATGRAYPWTPPRQYPGATLSNTATLVNGGSQPAPVTVSYYGDLSETRLTDGFATLHLQPVPASMQVNVNSETLVATGPGGGGRQSYLMAGTTPLTVAPFSTATWSLYGTGAGYVTLAYRESSA